MLTEIEHMREALASFASDSRPLEEVFLDDMVQGYLDGHKPENPEPSGNRSRSYRHGFSNGRDDLAHWPRATAQALREMADAAIAEDVAAARSGRPATSFDAASACGEEPSHASPTEKPVKASTIANLTPRATSDPAPGRGGTIEALRRLMIARGLELHARAEIQPNTAWTPSAMLKSAAAATGKSYRHGQYLEAAADLRRLVDDRRDETQLAPR
jgi:hypothetical protein